MLPSSPASTRRSLDQTRLLAAVALGVGVVVRLRQWLVGRSLWNDEAALALNIIARDAAGLLRPLDYLQGAPIGYLLLVKLAITLGGPGERALRLVALVAGIAALLLFVPVARRLVGVRAGALAAALLALAPALATYSNEVKQYALDVLATVLALALFAYLRRGTNGARAAVAAAAGALLVWLAHPAVFVLAAVGVVCLVEAWRRGDRRSAGWLVGVGFVWGGSFLAQTLLSLDALMGSDMLLDYWQGGFTPSLLRLWQWPPWLWLKLNDLTSFVLGLSAVGLVAAAAGVVALTRRDPGLLVALLLPLGLLLLAAALGRYPFADRLLLFSAPLVALLVAEGVVSLWTRVRRLGRLPAVALVVVLLFPALLATWRAVVAPHYKEEMAPALAHVAAGWQEGDRLIVYYGGALAFGYYGPRYGFDEADVTMIERSRENWLPYFRALDDIVADGGRVWFVFAHVYTEGGASEEALLVNYLYQLGYPALDVYLVPGASVYLFTFP